MSVIYLMLPIALIMGLSFVVAFIRSATEGQYDDLDTPAHRILLEEKSSDMTTPRQFKKGSL